MWVFPPACLPACWPPAHLPTAHLPTAHLARPPAAGDFGDAAVQGRLVHQLRYLASVVTQCFSAFGELLAMPKRFAEIGGGWPAPGSGEWGVAAAAQLLPASSCLPPSDHITAHRLRTRPAPPPGGITRVSEALEVIDKAARLDAATAAALASTGGEGGEGDTIRFT